MKNEIHVDFTNKDNGANEGLIFYSYQELGIWYADNYDIVDILNIKDIK